MLTAQREPLLRPAWADQPQKVIANAAHLLSNLSQFVGVVMAPRRTSVFRHIEFLRLSERRLLVIIVSPDGDVQNRVIFTEADYTQSQLIEAANFLNAHYAGLAIEQVRERLKNEVDTLRGEIASLMQAAVQVSSEAMTQAQDEVVISGERNLLAVSDFSSDMGTCAAPSSCSSKRPSSCACWTSPARPRACASTSAAKARSCRSRSCHRQRTLRGGRPGGGHAGRDRPHAHALRPDDPDRGHHLQAGQQRAEPPQVGPYNRS
jgi:hypothetical protein